MIILEKIRDGKALIIDGDREMNIPVQMLADCSEGDVIFLCDGIYVTDREATEARNKEILALQDSLWSE